MLSGTPGDWLRHAATAIPTAPALVGAGGTLNFARLAQHIERLAAYFSTLPSPILALQPSQRWETALALYAGWYAGKTLLPLDPRLSAAQRLNLTAPLTDWQLIDAAAYQQLGALLSVPSAVPPDSPGGLMVATSGSSGAPKLVPLPASVIAAAVHASGVRIRLDPGDGWLACLPLFHLGGLAILLRALAAGACVYLHERFDPQAVWSALHTQAITHLSLVPALLHQLLEVAQSIPPPTCLRAVLIGGDTLDPELARRAATCGWPLCVSYGMSETASQIATDCGAEAGFIAGRVGRPLPGFELRIHAPDAHGCGRLWVRGPAVMPGYVNRVGSPGEGLIAGWLDTGDLGRLDADGVLHILGRVDDVLKIGGEKIYPQSLEPLLRACPDVTDAVLIGCVDPIWGQRLIAVFSGSATEAEVAAYCNKVFQGAERPRAFVQLSALPLGGSGKVDRLVLNQLVRHRRIE